MKVKMNTIYAGPSGNASPGQEIDVSADEARDLIAGGYASAVDCADEKPTRKRTAKLAAVPVASTGAVAPSADLSADQIAAKENAQVLLDQASDEPDPERQAGIVAAANEILVAAGLPEAEAAAE